MFNFWWSAEWAKNVDQNQKNKKGPLRHPKIKCSFLDYIQLLMIRQILRKKCQPKCIKNKKGPLSHWKIKCSFLDYIQLLMISQAIWAKNINWNAKKWKRPPKSFKNEMFIFGLAKFNFWWSAKWSEQKMLTKMQKNAKKAP